MHARQCNSLKNEYTELHLYSLLPSYAVSGKGSTVLFFFTKAFWRLHNKIIILPFGTGLTCSISCETIVLFYTHGMEIFPLHCNSDGSGKCKNIYVWCTSLYVCIGYNFHAYICIYRTLVAAAALYTTMHQAHPMGIFHCHCSFQE